MKYYLLITALLLSSFSWGHDDFNNGLAEVSKAGKNDISTGRQAGYSIDLSAAGFSSLSFIFCFA